MSYDPTEWGARCHECPLRHAREGGPVPPERNGGSVALVAQMPSSVSCEEGRPLVGRTGIEAQRALLAAGLERKDVTFTHALACRVPKGDLKRYMKRLEADNRRRSKAGEQPVASPVECCKPRLRAELEDIDAVITLGAMSTHMLIGGSTSIMDLRGQLLTAPRLTGAGHATGDEWQIVPTIANFSYARRWKRVFYQDVQRAVAWFHGRLPWTPPSSIRYFPDVDSEGYAQPFVTSYQCETALNQIRAFLARTSSLCVDVETKATKLNAEGKPAFDPLDDELRCIGLSDTKDAIVIGIRSVRLEDASFGIASPGRRLWPEHYEPVLARVLFDGIEDGRLILGHNFGYYDRLVFEQWFEQQLGKRPAFARLFDTLMGARVVEPELPKGLGFCATMYLAEGTPAWKADHTATEAETDASLYEYNALDVIINARLAPVLAQRIAEREQQTVLRVDQRMQEICAGLHRVGLRINEGRRREWRDTLRGEMATRHTAMLQRLEELGVDAHRFGPKSKDAFNPNSPFHLREVLFDEFDTAPPSEMKSKEIFTDTGERSVGKPIINAYLADPTLTRLHPFLEEVRRFKKAAKLYGTYIVKADPTHGSSYVRATSGRVHAEWKAYGTLVGRPACATPNLLNQPKKLRDMYEAQEGYAFVGADWSALHLRLIAHRWRIPSLLEAFHKGLDAHSLFAGVLFGDRFWKADGHPDGPRGCSGDYEGNAGKMRSVAKTVRYAGAYMARPETIWRVVRATEDKKGNLPYKNMTLEYVYGIHEAWMRGEPQWQQAWDQEIEEWMTLGYKCSPILGRRIDFIDGEIADDGEIEGNIGNKLVNTPILTAEADFANQVLCELVDALPFERYGPGSGLVQTNYDSILLEVPEKEAPYWAGVLHDLMNREIPGWEIPMVADVKIDRTWDKT